LEILKKEMPKNEVSILGVSEERWKGQGEISSGDYTVYYSRSERAEKGVGIVVHKSVVRSVVKKIVYNDRIIVIKLQARNCLLQRVTEGKIQGGIEVTGRQGRRRRKLLDDLKEMRGYSHLKEKALDRTIWLARFGRGF
jgi:hypothetical protein